TTCADDRAHQADGRDAGAPRNGACFCGEMAGRSDRVRSPAVPAALLARPVMAVVLRCASYPAPFPLPPSPSFAPESPPPNALACADPVVPSAYNFGRSVMRSALCSVLVCGVTITAAAQEPVVTVEDPPPVTGTGLGVGRRG